MRFIQLEQEISISEVELYLVKNNDKFYDSIEITSCGKWSKWLNNKSIHLYPCVCPVRNEDCIFIETYYTFSKVLEIYQKKEKYKNELKVYKQIKHSKSAIFEWIRAIEWIVKEILLFETKIKIKSNGVSHKFNLNSSDFEVMLKLRKIFIEHYYSGEYKNY